MLITDAQIHLWEPEPSGPTLAEGWARPRRIGQTVSRPSKCWPRWTRLASIGGRPSSRHPGSARPNAYALEAAAMYPTRFAVMGLLRSGRTGCATASLQSGSSSPTCSASVSRSTHRPWSVGLTTVCSTGSGQAAPGTGVPVMALFAGPLLTRVPPIVERQPDS